MKAKLLIGFILLTPFQIFACSCAEFSVQSVWSTSSRVFVAHVREAKLASNNDWGDINALVVVEEVLKGAGLEVGQTIKLTASTNTVACGIESFSVNGEYIFLLNSGNEVVSCSGSGLLGAKGYERSEFSKKYLDDLRKLSESEKLQQ